MGGGGKKGGSPLQVKRSFPLLPSCRKRTTKEELEGNPEKQERGESPSERDAVAKKGKKSPSSSSLLSKTPPQSLRANQLIPPFGPAFCFVTPACPLTTPFVPPFCGTTSTTVLLRKYTMIPHLEEKAPLSSSAPFSLVALPRPADGGEGGAAAAK